MEQSRLIVIAAAAVSLAASLFAFGAAVSSDDDGSAGAPPASSEPAASPSPESAPAASPAPGSEAASASEAPAGDRVEISIAGFQFGDGEAVTVPVGTEVVWTNNDSMDHSVEFTDGSEIPPSPELADGDTYSFTFTEPGTYEYICGLHPRMKATVVVEG